MKNRIIGLFTLFLWMSSQIFGMQESEQPVSGQPVSKPSQVVQKMPKKNPVRKQEEPKIIRNIQELNDYLSDLMDVSEEQKNEKIINSHRLNNEGLVAYQLKVENSYLMSLVLRCLALPKEFATLKNCKGAENIPNLKSLIQESYNDLRNDIIKSLDQKNNVMLSMELGDPNQIQEIFKLCKEYQFPAVKTGWKSFFINFLKKDSGSWTQDEKNKFNEHLNVIKSKVDNAEAIELKVILQAYYLTMLYFGSTMQLIIGSGYNWERISLIGVSAALAAVLFTVVCTRGGSGDALSPDVGGAVLPDVGGAVLPE